MFKVTQGFPRQIFLEIINFCNAGCRLCDYSRLSNISRKNSFMLLKAIEKIAEQIGEREIDIYFQSGQPLLHPFFTEITRRIKQACPHSRLHLSTNGSLLSRHSHFLDNLSTISFSIDGFWDGKYFQRRYIYFSVLAESYTFRF
jgi:MoaA/NifB/PqqE/SkfB family radical SAM enzyme